ncbi:hypothetical protein LINGRAHAP2_LOCUS11064, partial [Linum grandiflorum]
MLNNSGWRAAIIGDGCLTIVRSGSWIGLRSFVGCNHRDNDDDAVES